MVKQDHSSIECSEPSTASTNDAGELHTTGTRRRSYGKPALTKLGRIDQLTLGSGGSCTDGVQNDKKLTGSGKCP